MISSSVLITNTSTNSYFHGNTLLRSTGLPCNRNSLILSGLVNMNLLEFKSIAEKLGLLLKKLPSLVFHIISKVSLATDVTRPRRPELALIRYFCN
jgi:hypothetical protein